MVVDSSSELPLAVPATHFEQMYRLKYGDPERHGWALKLRARFGYRTPDDVYDALVSSLVTEQTTWLDVGCGRMLLPDDNALARVLADRCRRLVGLDPDATLEENPYVHEKVRQPIDRFDGREQFDLVTLRMVAEHIADPESTVAALARLTHPGSLVVVFTVDHWAATAVAARLVPFRLHHGAKRVLWGSEERDTFPVAYRMNTRRRLVRLFEGAGFRSRGVVRLAHCGLFFRSRWLHRLELRLWKATRSVGLTYPENCLLGVFERIGANRGEYPFAESPSPRVEGP